MSTAAPAPDQDRTVTTLDSRRGRRRVDRAARHLSAVDLDRTERIADRAADNRRLLDGAADTVAGVLGGRTDRPRTTAEQTVAALRALGFDADLPAATDRTADPVLAVLRSNGIRSRRVDVQGPSLAPMLGFAGADVVPVAPGTSRPDLAPTALAVYRPLGDPVPGVGGLLRRALGGSTRDLVQVAVAGLLAALIALLIPAATGLLVPMLTGGAGPSQIWWLAGLLVAGVAAGALLLAARNSAVVRVQGRLQAILEPAVWDRLLRLDSRFFRRYSTGQLVQRANAVAASRRTLGDVAINAILGALFGIASLGALFLLDARLAGLVVAGTALLVGALIVIGSRQQRHEAEVFRLYGDIHGFLYQALTGIDKIQVAGREIQVFARWAALFSRQKRADMASLQYGAVVTGLLTAAQPLLLVVLFAGLAGFGFSVPVGVLVAVITAVGQLVLSLGQVSAVIAAVYGLGPMLERLQPILQAAPEEVRSARDPGPITGRIELRQVGFSYPGTATPVLDSLDLVVEPGEMVALVGPSGAGKSTVVRLLLGLDKPDTGQVLVDDQDLAGLDLGQLRRRFGVVLQNSKVTGSSLLDLLLGGAADATEADAWRAAELAGLADDLRRLPMGLATRLTDGASVISGGQMQRLLIARALVKRPAVLLLDEATSALDNAVQRQLSDRLADLGCTRIVVAHRLSTIRRADRIHYLSAGRITHSGTYRELLDSCPAFARLAQRQEL